MRREDGSVVGRLLVWALVLAVAAGAALFAFVRTQEPFRAGGIAVGMHEALASPPEGFDAALRRNGEIYVATMLVNDGPFTLRLDGLGTPAEPPSGPYVPVELRLGNGITASPDAAAPFSPIELASGAGIGVLVIYAVDPSRSCDAPGGGKGSALTSFPVRYSAAGVAGTQEVAPAGLRLRVAPFTAKECRRAVG
jgi:hypothetical protein